ncbi:MAG: 1,2-phenylacetyl-CoA epoxidase subunit B [Calditrichaeota bacterium]|nr:MAG: 1,2-phenylacetyl-CoA epoxidase subunit B [Calditrichota bacterium]
MNHKTKAENEATDTQWPLWEVFVQEKQGAPHEHAGSVHAPDAEIALQNARDVYARRGRLLSIWVVPSAAITATTPSDDGPFFDPGNDKIYRHPQFYKVPRGVKMF